MNTLDTDGLPRRKKAQQDGLQASPDVVAPLPTTVSPSAAQPQQPQARQPVNSRGAPTDFVNFSRRFNANADVAKREADKYATQATNAAGKAANSLQAAQTTFANGVNTGSVAPPPGSNAPSATNTGAAIPVLPPVAMPTASTSQALEGESTRPAAQQQALTSESTKPSADASGYSLADLLAKAGQKYTGPEGLSGDTQKQAIGDAYLADQQLNLLGNKYNKDTGTSGIQTLVNENPYSGSTGSDALSGALIGAAGRQNFDALRARFNPNKDLIDAQDKAIETAADAKTQSQANADAWGRMTPDGGAADAPDGSGAEEDPQYAAQKAYDDAIANLPEAGKGQYGDAKNKQWSDFSPQQQDQFAQSLVKGVDPHSYNGNTLKGYAGAGAQGLTVDEVKSLIAAMPRDIYERFTTSWYPNDDANPDHKNNDNPGPQARMIAFLMAMKAAGGVNAGRTSSKTGSTRSN